jgi:hypothetical protein
MTAETEAASAYRKIRWFALLAMLIATAVAIGAVIAIGDEVLSADAMEGHGVFYDQWVESAVGAGAGLLAALVVWTIFYLWLFRKRAKLWKSIVALVLMILSCVIIATVARLVTVVAYVDADDATVRAHQEAGMERRRALRAQIAPNIDGLRMDQGMPRITSVADVVAHKAAIDAARAQFQAYRNAVTADLTTSRAALDAMDIHPDARLRGYEYYDERLLPTSNTQRHLDLTDQILERGSALLDNLLANRRGWLVEDGRIAFTDRALWEETRRRGEELDELGAQLDNVQGAMGRGLDGSRLLGEDSESAAPKKAAVKKAPAKQAAKTA